MACRIRAANAGPPAFDDITFPNAIAIHTFNDTILSYDPDPPHALITDVVLARDVKFKVYVSLNVKFSTAAGQAWVDADKHSGQIVASLINLSDQSWFTQSVVYIVPKVGGGFAYFSPDGAAYIGDATPDEWQTLDVIFRSNHEGIGQPYSEARVDGGTLVELDTANADGANPAIGGIYVGQAGLNAPKHLSGSNTLNATDDNAIIYIDDVTMGTTAIGSSDLLNDDFEAGELFLPQWQGTYGEISVVCDKPGLYLPPTPVG